jgi:DNA mismatch repair protein MutS2
MLKSAPAIVKEQEYYSEPAAPDELRLRYLTVDEALPRLANFLHDTYSAGLKQVKIIHGKGSGTLRLTVRRELGRHSLVKSFRAGEKWEGGEGVTIVEFSEK